MSKCPNSSFENEAPAKTRKYSFLNIYAYTCKGCGIYYGDYYSNMSGRRSSTLKFIKWQGFVNALHPRLVIIQL
jgi:hypothetical protein